MKYKLSKVPKFGCCKAMPFYEAKVIYQDFSCPRRVCWFHTKYKTRMVYVAHMCALCLPMLIERAH